MPDRIRDIFLGAISAARYGVSLDPPITQAITKGDRQLRIDQLEFDSLAWMEFCISVQLQSGQELTPVDFEGMQYVFQIEDWLRIKAPNTDKGRADRVATGGILPGRRPLLNPEIENKIRAFTWDWKGERSTPGALLLGVNRGGKERPLFWCLQLSEDLNQLARHLGPERPLYGMRSGAFAMSYTEANTAALARRYIDEILVIDETGPYLIAGHCQGGIVAVEIAKQLQETGRQILLLTILDYPIWDLFRGQVYPSKVAFFSGINSHFNPYRRFRSPELGWRKLFPQGLRFDLLPTDHDGLFSDQAMRAFVPKLRSALDWGEKPTSPIAGDTSSSGGLPKATYRARFQTLQTLSMRPGQAGIIRVRVTNIGRTTWAPTATSGIALGNHWLTPAGELLVWADGRTPLHKLVPPKGRIALYLQVCAPSVAGEYLLEIDLVEEGVTWFKEKGSVTAVVRVTVSDEKRLASWYVGDQPARYIVFEFPRPSSIIRKLLERLSLLAETWRAVGALRLKKSGVFREGPATKGRAQHPLRSRRASTREKILPGF
jgi:hypothetical protein